MFLSRIRNKKRNIENDEMRRIRIDILKTDKEMMLETGGNMKFKVGDKVRAKTDKYYRASIIFDWEGIIVKLNNSYFEAKTTKSDYEDDFGKIEKKLNYEDFELVQEDNKMEDVRRLLKNGDICVLRDGRNFIVMFNYCGCDILKELDGGDWMDLSDRGVDLLSVADECFDVIEIKRKNLPVGRLDDMSLYETIWKREEVKEMTMEELEKLLGYKVKIKANKN